MKVGIIFGGSSREREIAFAGGRTVYDNLNKALFEPIPIFVDSLGNFVQLDWQYLYKGTIRDFYPPSSHLSESLNQFQIYIESLDQLTEEQLQCLIQEVGTPLRLAELKNIIDFAFLALHGEWGEDGQIQGLLESIGLPYSGSGIRASSIGMDKSFQKKIMQAGGFHSPEMRIIGREDWLTQQLETAWVEKTVAQIGLPLVVRPANQGSSIGVAIVHKQEDLANAIDAAFFLKRLQAEEWLGLETEEQIQRIRNWTDIRSGLGFPINILRPTTERITQISHPEKLLVFLNEHIGEEKELLLEAVLTEQKVVLEGFIEGREFSCVVIQNDKGDPIALPPTEIIKGKEVFDYRAKYLAGLSRKQTPIDLAEDQIEAIRKACERLYNYLEFNVYARIDGFIKADGTIILNDPNTTSGMLPSSFFFHQAAEIGLNPSQFLTYIIRTSLQERSRSSLKRNSVDFLLEKLDKAIEAQRQSNSKLEQVAVILGGYSSERHISVESGRNIYEKLSASTKYQPIPIFLTGNENNYQLYQLPINLLLKDNADDIHDKILDFKAHPIIRKIQKETTAITKRFVDQSPILQPQKIDFSWLKSNVDAVFIALHGRPGEDGAIQTKLEQQGLAYNGSDSKSAAITINKYETLQRLKTAGFTVTDQYLVEASDFWVDVAASLDKIEAHLSYPLIAKPIDDGCSAAVKKIKTRKELQAFLEILFRSDIPLPPLQANILGIQPKEEFPVKSVALLETLITQKEAVHFLEITGGLLTYYDKDGKLCYEVFEPSEVLASGEVLSLEEKFLAGEGQNITPARFAVAGFSHEHISAQVRSSLKTVAQTLAVTGYARIDAFVRVYADGRAETIVIEVNSLPGMTPATCIFHQTAVNGYKPIDFIDHILRFGKERLSRALKTED